ncbi:C-X-C chemokine receptor type 2-like [Embiotoca jacksoni]|uniref:C-X-C chemokine receptor type 2-like n=1 Tax=Embiotoca jacksoni TaxID=100190 RepID=UPI0037046CD6
MSLTYVFEENYFDLNESVPLILNPKTLSCDLESLKLPTAVIMSVLLIAIFLLAIPGNLLVVWVIGTSRQALTPSDVYLFHLTIADGLMALTLPFSAASLTWGWIFGDFLCKFLSLIIEANFYTSIIFLACISIDRYLMIVHASETFRTRQKMCSRFLCTAVWVLGGGLALPALFNDAIKIDSDLGQVIICSETFDIGNPTGWRLAIRGFRHIFGFLVPLVVMVACYSITVARLLQTRGFQKHRAMRLIIAVLIAFLLCWTPYHLTIMIDTLMRAKLIQFDCAMRSRVTKSIVLTNSLALLHSCINPFLYAFVGKKFRNKMVLLFQRKRRQERISGSKFSRSTSQTSEGSRTVF